MPKPSQPTNSKPFIKQVLVIGFAQTEQQYLQQRVPHESYEIVFCENIQQANQAIQQSSASQFHAYLLDESLLQNKDFGDFHNLRKQTLYNHIPVILHLHSNQSETIQQGLEIDMFFYLIAPYSSNLLISVLDAATQGFTNHQEISRRIDIFENSHPLLQKAVFHLQTVEEAQAVSAVLAYMAPEQKRVAIGLFELMLNSIEHGNLQIGYENKTTLIKRGILQSEITKRIQQQDYKDKYVMVMLKRTEHYLEYTISDSGIGFNAAPYLDFSEDRAMDNHGRGIMIANRLSFDSIQYKDNGSTVVCRIKTD